MTYDQRHNINILQPERHWLMPQGIAFAPSDIAGLQLWIDSSDSSTIFQDAAKTTPAGDTDVVGAWADKSGLGNDVTQATTSKKPSYQLAVQNGLAIVRFAGTDDVLSGGDILDFGVASKTIFVVAKKTSGTGGSFVTKSGGAPGAGKFGLAYFSSDAVSFYSNVTPTNYHVTVARAGGSFEILASVVNRTTGDNELRANGGVLGNTSFTPDTGDSLNNAFELEIGDFATLAPLTGDIAEVLIYGSSLSDNNVAIVESYLSDKWGVTLS